MKEPSKNARPQNASSVTWPSNGKGKPSSCPALPRKPCTRLTRALAALVNRRFLDPGRPEARSRRLVLGFGRHYRRESGPGIAGWKRRSDGGGLASLGP